MHERMMRKRALETVCYVAGAGAFSVFIRWLQTMLAYNDDGLVEKSLLNVLVPAMILLSAWVFRGFIKRFAKDGLYIGEDFYEVMKNEGRLYEILRWLIGAVMFVGSVMLLMECEVDRDAGFLRVLSLLGAISAFAFPILLAEANKPHVSKQNGCCVLGSVPIVMFSFWLVTCYKMNSINPVVWDYAVEVITIIVCVLSFFRLAGFQFSNPAPERALFFAMLGGALCIMNLADNRYMGMQLMYFSAAAMQLLYVWIMICNMRKKEKEETAQPEDGFEHL